PLVRILKALETLDAGDRLEVLIDRRPMLLYPQLDARGFTYVTEEREPGQFGIVITRPAETGCRQLACPPAGWRSATSRAPRSPCPGSPPSSPATTTIPACWRSRTR